MNVSEIDGIHQGVCVNVSEIDGIHQGVCVIEKERERANFD